MPLGMLIFGPFSDTVDVSYIILLSGIMMIIIAIVPLFKRSLMKEGLKVDLPITKLNESE
jgi:hypothetical protein